MILLHPTLHPNFVQFLKEFNRTFDYFECHELLEEYWKEVAPGNKEHPAAVLVLLSTSMYHWRRGNLAGAFKTMRTFVSRFEHLSNSPFNQFIDVEQLREDARQSLSSIENKESFRRFLILVKDPELQDLIEQGDQSNVDIEFLTHKHMLRDRSEILSEREKQKNIRNKRS